MEIKILSSSKTLYEGESEEITLPGREGLFQILEGHAGIFALLGKGEINIGQSRKIPISSGIAEALGNKVVILAEEAEN